MAKVQNKKKSPHSRQASSGHHRTIILYHTLTTSEKRSCDFLQKLQKTQHIYLLAWATPLLGGGDGERRRRNFFDNR